MGLSPPSRPLKTFHRETISIHEKLKTLPVCYFQQTKPQACARDGWYSVVAGEKSKRWFIADQPLIENDGVENILEIGFGHQPDTLACCRGGNEVLLPVEKASRRSILKEYLRKENDPLPRSRLAGAFSILVPSRVCCTRNETACCCHSGGICCWLLVAPIEAMLAS